MVRPAQQQVIDHVVNGSNHQEKEDWIIIHTSIVFIVYEFMGTNLDFSNGVGASGPWIWENRIDRTVYLRARGSPDADRV